MRIRFDQLSRAFSNRCVFDQNPQRISVDRRAKRIEMYAFSHENALVRTGPRSKLSFQAPSHFGMHYNLIWPQKYNSVRYISNIFNITNGDPAYNNNRQFKSF